MRGARVDAQNLFATRGRKSIQIELARRAGACLLGLSRRGGAQLLAQRRLASSPRRLAPASAFLLSLLFALLLSSCGAVSSWSFPPPLALSCVAR
eukprot:4560801-Pyramimonas_sp.AAC.1